VRRRPSVGTIDAIGRTEAHGVVAFWVELTKEVRSSRACTREACSPAHLPGLTDLRIGGRLAAFGELPMALLARAPAHAVLGTVRADARRRAEREWRGPPRSPHMTRDRRRPEHEPNPSRGGHDGHCNTTARADS